MADFFEDQENMDEDDDIIVLYNEERDTDEEFYHLATLDVDEKWYVVLKPVEKLPDIEDDEVLIYEIRESDSGEDIFAAIERLARPCVKLRAIFCAYFVAKTFPLVYNP